MSDSVTPWTAACQAPLPSIFPLEFAQIQVHWVSDAIQSNPQMGRGHANLFLLEEVVMTCLVWDGDHESHCLAGSQMHLWPLVPSGAGFQRCLGIVTVRIAKGGNWLRQVSTFPWEPQCHSRESRKSSWAVPGMGEGTAFTGLQGRFFEYSCCSSTWCLCWEELPPSAPSEQMQLRAWRAVPGMDFLPSLSQLCSLVLWTTCATTQSHPDFGNR